MNNNDPSTTGGDPLDRWLREQADGPADLPPAAWDTPGEYVWQNVRQGLERRRRRRLLWWWCLAAGLAGAIALGGYVGTVKRAGKPVRQAAAPSLPEYPSAGSGLPAEKSRPAAPNPLSREGSAEPGLQPSRDAGENKTKKLGDHRPEQELNPVTRYADLPLPYDFPETKHTPPDTLTSRASHEPAETGPSVAALPGIAPLFLTVPPPQAPQWPYYPLPPDKKNRAWLAGASAGAVFTTRALRGNGVAGLNGHERGAWTWQGGVSLRRTFGNRWSLETGLYRTAIALRAERRGVVRFRADRERYDPGRDVYESSAQQSVQTSFGAVELRFDLSRPSGQYVQNQEIIRVLIQTEEEARYLRAPLLLRYTAGPGRWQWSAQAGLGVSLRTGYDWQATAAAADRQAIRAVQARLAGQARDFSPLLADAQLGLGISYRPGSRVRLSLSPELRHGLNSLTRGNGIRAYPVSAGVNAGLEWRLNKGN